MRAAAPARRSSGNSSGEHEQAFGQVWHLPTPPPVTARRFVHLIAVDVGRPLDLAPLDERVIRTLGLVWPVPCHGAEMLYQFRQPHSVDAGKDLSTFGPGRVTPFELGVARTVDWYRRTSAGRFTASSR